MSTATATAMSLSSGALLSKPAPARTRHIVYRTRGHRHGPITRLVSPSDLGELIKPFVFLDHVDIETNDDIGFGFHPHSGIATLTLLLEGGFAYEDSTGGKGVMGQGAVEWMQAGGGVWHTGNSVGKHIKGYQLWVALPPALENSPPVSMYLDADRFARQGPARVILGEWRGVRSPIPAPSPVNYLDVSLHDGELWHYDPPEGHDVAWIALQEGHLRTPEPVFAGELVVFEQAPTAITFQARGETHFVLGSAVQHPHELVLGHYSIHTSADALKLGEENIRRIGDDLRRIGKR
jgi:redox-sensitive bicupin YhaK (pirin superfamily)